MAHNDTSLTLATYNIHCCMGTDGIYDPDRTIKILRQINADIIALQEVESATNDPHNLLNTLTDKTGMKIVPGLTMFKETSCYGNAVLTRCDIKDLHHINISVGRHEPRGAIRFTIRMGNQTILIIATHLGLKRYERRIQVQSILKEFGQHPSDISVLMGDLNEWYRWGKTLRQLRNHFSQTGSPPTFPGHCPVLSLDRILIQPRSCLQSITPIKNRLTRVASDHLPLKATLVFS